MQWMSIIIPTSEVPAGLFTSMFSLFDSAFVLAGGPPDFAVMEYSPTPGKRVFYFSPQAVLFGGEFLSERGAVVCAAPPFTEETIPHIGAADATQRLLSDADSAVDYRNYDRISPPPTT